MPTLPTNFTWPDRRPIGIIQLGDESHRSATNPASWVLRGSADLDVTTPAGLADFQKKMLAVADDAVANLKRMNAQGCNLWGVDGGRLGTYIGSPDLATTLNPELDGIVDQVFAKFRSVGKVGVTIRADQLNQATGQMERSTDPLGTMIRKALYAHKRWGCNIFYVDSNIWTPMEGGEWYQVLPPTMLLQLHRAIPGSLIIPEHSITPGSTLQDPRALYTAIDYYRNGPCYLDMQKGPNGTPAEVFNVVPGAFSAVNINTQPEILTAHRSALVTAVKRGDLLMVNAAWSDPGIDAVIGIYAEAAVN